MSEHEIVELTDELVAELAVKFGVSEEEIRKQYAQTVALGPAGALAEMDQYMADLEAECDEIAADAAARWLHAGSDRMRNMAEFYHEGMDALSAEEIAEANVSDLFLKCSIALYKLAEANEQIAKLSDGNYRRGEG